jgi:Uncharacterized conserved protein (COG2071)
MFNLKNHPFAVEAFFESSLVLTFAVPKERIQHLIPECLTLDTFNDQWAFIAVAMVETKDLRPKGFPRFLGHDFFLTGYRIFVRYTSAAGRHLRGLYILHSETDKKRMNFLGNIFTHYQYTLTDIKVTKTPENIQVHSVQSGMDIDIQKSENPDLPMHSPFTSWKEARRFAGPLPFTFTYHQSRREVLIIEGLREHWEPKPVRVINQQIKFINELNMEGVKLASAFLVEKIPYYWKKGRTEIWKP